MPQLTMFPTETQHRARGHHIRELPLTEQPRYRLQHYGPGALSTGELLVIILNLDTFDTARELLATFNMRRLPNIPEQELAQYPGIGPAAVLQEDERHKGYRN